MTPSDWIKGKPDLENVRKLDLLPVPMIRRMQRLGMAIDIPYLQQLSSELAAEMENLKADICSEIPEEALDRFMQRSRDVEDWSPINPNSRDQLAELLFDVLGLGRGRQLKRTKSGRRIKTDKKQLETLKHEHPIVQKVLDYGERSKLKSTYADALPRLAKHHPRGECGVCGLRHLESTWRVHTEILTTRTDTGRLASKNPNLQNIPARTELGRRMRAGFVASPGCLLASRDFSGIELRILAHCAGEGKMIRIFLEHGDIHTLTAMEAFQLPEEKVDKLLHRAPCKNVNFGICVAKGQRVLTNRGLVPIENVARQDLVWDGEEWVEHHGVIHNGRRKVVSYCGLRATPDHKVWTASGEQVPISEAMAARRHLARSGSGEMPIRVRFTSHRKPVERERIPGHRRSLFLLWEREDSSRGQCSGGEIQIMQVQKDLARRGDRKAGGSVSFDPAEMQQSTKSGVEELRWEGNQGPVWHCGEVRFLHIDGVPQKVVQGSGRRQDRQQWGLRTWEHPAGEAVGESAEQTDEQVCGVQGPQNHCNGSVGFDAEGLSRVQVKQEQDSQAGLSWSWMEGNSDPEAEEEEVYDILNAGPRHRFTVEGILVSNCYGLQDTGLYDLMAVTYATAGRQLPDWLTVEWCGGFIRKWFSIYPQVEPYMELQHYRARRYGCVWDLFGRIRRVPEVQSTLPWIQNAGLRQAGNMPIQAASAGLMKLAMDQVEIRLLEYLDAGVWCWPLMSIHDELLVEVEGEWGEAVLEMMGMEMDRLGDGWSRVPIESDGKVMERWEK